jgi:hypothetical protein
VQVQGGYAEFSVPKTPSNIDVSLPAVVSGLKPRWSAWLWQKQGYNGAEYYGPGTDRVRPLGVVRDGASAGTAYLALYAGRAATHVVAGHPVVVDDEDIIVHVVATTADPAGRPTGWQVAINNPDTAAHVATVSAGMPGLPGFVFGSRTLTLAAGQLVIRDEGGVYRDGVSGVVIP